MTQPQLLNIAIDPIDVVYTPDYVARDMVEFFKPTGSVLEPSCGNGAFLKYLPGAQWCEIEQGRDFYQWNTPVDWIIGNPPYSQYSQWLQHSMEIAENICYLLPCNKAFNSYAMIKRVNAWGGACANAGLWRRWQSRLSYWLCNRGRTLPARL